jgi:hypothetical protein
MKFIEALRETINAIKSYSDKRYLNQLKGKVSGTVVAMDDVSPLAHKMPVKLSSKNLIPYPYVYTTNTKDGITAVDNGDGSVTLNGTAEKMCYFVFYRDGNIPVGIYTLSGIANAPNGVYLQASGVNANGAVSSYPTLKNGSITFDAIYSGVKAITLFIPQGAVVENFTLKPQLEKGTVETPYVPYVPEDTAVTIKSYGKNLIPYPYYDTTRTTNGITFTDNGDGSITVKGTATADAYFKFTKTTLDVPVAAPIGVPLRISGGVGSKENNNRITVTARKIKADGTYVSFIDSPHASIEVGQLAEGETLGNISILVSTGSTVDATIYPQIELGTVATAYAPYTEYETVTTTLAKGAELNAVVPNMTIYTDTAGAVIECRYNRDINRVLSKVHPELGIPLDPDAPEKPKETATFELWGIGSSILRYGQFTYEVGMTWEDFVESDYNPPYEGPDGGMWFTIEDGKIYAVDYEVYGTNSTIGSSPDNVYPETQLDVSSTETIQYINYFIYD